MRVKLMVASAATLWVYWRDAPGIPAGAVRVVRLVDLSGRAPEESLDGCGVREVEADGDYRFTGVLPGHLYGAQVGYRDGAGRFTCRMRSDVVKTPETEPLSRDAAALAVPDRLSFYPGMGCST